MSILNTKTLLSSLPPIHVHPSVPFQALTQYTRRFSTEPRLIGLLLGSKSNQVVNCLPLITSKPTLEEGDAPVEDGEWILDEDHLSKQIDLLSQLNTNEEVIGWYIVASGTDITDADIDVHENVISEYTRNPLLLCIDVGLSQNPPRVKLQAYQRSELKFGNKTIASKFDRVTVSNYVSREQKVALKSIISGKMYTSTYLESPKLDQEIFHDSITLLSQRLKQVGEYVQSKIDGKDDTHQDQTIGSMIDSALSELPSLDSQSFEDSFHRCLQDLLMTIYLVKLTKAHTVLASNVQ